MIEKLADLQPIMLLVMLVLMYSIESVWPYLRRPVNRWRHDWRNFVVSIISFVVNGFIGLGVVTFVQQTEMSRWGVMNLLGVGDGVKIVLGVLLLDLADYVSHNLQHRIAFLWLFHRVHHSDPNLNATSSLRFHPVDVVVAQGVAMCVAVLVFGIPMVAVIIYGTLGLLLLVPQHSNFRMPDWVERYVSWVFVTPGWHKIHHSSDQRQTDSHFCDVFTFWDRIFGTWHRVKPDEIKYGLEEFGEDRQHRVGYLMLSPFKKLRAGGPRK
ncbi:MAG: sterol desaturase family protein [Bacteroidetes bacterium]|nr:sterol desaturase family protein [Bacteroidota bacterium]